MLFDFCPKCGLPMKELMSSGNTRRACQSCGFIQYLNPTVGVAVILMEKGRILLVRRKGSFYGSWCIPCGHLEWDEDVRLGAKREMLEETGLDVDLTSVFEVLSNFHDPAHHTVGIWFLGKRTLFSGSIRPGSDASEVRFFELDNLPKDMAFPTDKIVCQKLQKKDS